MNLIEDHWGSIYFTAEWAIRLAMVVAVPFRRSPEAARSWLLLLFFLPIPGLVLYLLIGRPRFPKWRRQRFAGLPRDGIAADAIAGGERAFPAEIAPDRGAIALLARNLGHLPPVGGNAVEVIADYDGFVDRLCTAIDGARHHVHLLVYIFADDAVGRRVIAALARARARDVACRVMVDAFGSRPWAKGVLSALHAAGVDAIEALPIAPLGRHGARRDLRNHRKLIVIDGASGFIGSQNIVAADFKPGVRNEELVAAVAGPVVASLQAVFLADWYLETERNLAEPALFPPAASAGHASAQLLPSGPDYPVSGSERLTVELVYAARRRVVLTTPYFIPDEGLIEALQSAVLRGVEVSLVVSLVQDQWLVGLAQRSFYADLLESGVRIFQYRDRLLHAKHVVVDDDIASIGSSNVDIRSFTLNAEANLLVYGAEQLHALEPILDRYRAGSIELTAEGWRHRPFQRKIAENVARLISPLL